MSYRRSDFWAGGFVLRSIRFQQQQIESHLDQAREFLKNKHPDLAAREYSTVVALDPNNVDARGNLGVLLYFEGDYAKAAPQP